MLLFGLCDHLEQSHLVEQYKVGLFIKPQGQKNISEQKSKSYKIVIVSMTKWPEFWYDISIPK